MGVPQFDVQGSLFESLGSIAPQLFGDQDKYQLFAKKVWPVLARCREQLAECYTSDNGGPGIEPVVLLGVLIFQFLERVPDRQAVEMVKYHLGWKREWKKPGAKLHSVRRLPVCRGTTGTAWRASPRLTLGPGFAAGGRRAGCSASVGP